MCGRRCFAQTCRALRWTCVCSTRRGADWYTSTVCIRTPCRIRRFERGSYPGYFLLWTGQWPSPSSLIFGYRYQSQGHPRVKCRQTASRDAVTSADAAAPRRVSFSPEVSILTEEMPPEPADTAFPPDDRDVTMTDDAIRPAAPPATSLKTVSPPPGFPQFSWPQEDWMLSGDPSLDPGLRFVTSWSTRILKERAAELPPLPLSPMAAKGSKDSITVQVGSSTDETVTPVGVVGWSRRVQFIGNAPHAHRRVVCRENNRLCRRTFSSKMFCGLRPLMFQDSLREPMAAAPLEGYLGGVRPGMDHSSMNDRQPPFGSWEQAARLDTQRIARRITLSP